jgi:peptidyl-prolyl cis-trans isomerase B (cyclophilin B)
MEVLLYDETPLHRDNFLKLVDEKYYDGTLFHRVIKDFMIQGGDPDSKNAAPGAMLGSGGPGYTLPAEILPQLYHKKGALAAARQGDNVNPERRSSGSQFYIVQGRTFDLSTMTQMEASLNRGVAPGKEFKYSEQAIKDYTNIGGTPHLDGQYTVFGEVIKGLEIVDKIAVIAADGRSRPKEDVKMTVTRIK